MPATVCSLSPRGPQLSLGYVEICYSTLVLCLASASATYTTSGVTCFPKTQGGDPHPASGRSVAPDPRLGRLSAGLTVSLCCSSLGEAWAQVKKSLADESEVHLKFSAKVTPPCAPLGWSHRAVLPDF